MDLCDRLSHLLLSSSRNWHGSESWLRCRKLMMEWIMDLCDRLSHLLLSSSRNWHGSES